eukprot:scpid99972/ scgid33019/ 
MDKKSRVGLPRPGAGSVSVVPPRSKRLREDTAFDDDVDDDDVAIIDALINEKSSEAATDAATDDSADSANASPVTCPGDRPLPDDELERYVTWCINRVFTSKKVLSEQSEKKDKLQAQIDGNSFQDHIIKKFSKLSDRARLIECTEYVNKQIAACNTKLSKAEATLDTANTDFNILAERLSSNEATNIFASQLTSRFKYLSGLRQACIIAKQCRTDLTSARKDKPKDKMDVQALPPTSEEIGALIKKEVTRQVISQQQQRQQPKKQQQQQQ